MISNQLAQFGRNSGSGIVAGVNQGLNRRAHNNALRQQRELGVAELAQNQGQHQDQIEREYTANGYRVLSGLSPEERPAAYQAWLSGAQQRGFDIAGVPTEYSDQALNTLGFASDASLVQKGASQKSFSTVGGGNIVDVGGVAHFAVPSFDPNSNSLSTLTSPVGGSLVSRLGETAEDQTNRALTEAQGKSDIEVDEFGRRRAVEESTASGIAVETGRGRGAAERETEDIGLAQSVGRGIPTLKRTIALLDSVGTGGINRVQLAATNFLGVTGADEGELSANLGKAVLSQLREVFGAQFTEKEGDRLTSIEAGFGKSAATNKRLLANTLDIATDYVNRGIDAAIAAGDTRTAEELGALLDKQLDPDAVLRELAGESSDLPQTGRASVGDTVNRPGGDQSLPGGSQQAAPSAPTPGQTQGAQSPQSQEEYDSLPSGALFIDPDDGKTYRKP